MYMPGHAGNFILRLFGLSAEFMPILEKGLLNKLVEQWEPIELFNKLQNYRFSTSTQRHATWQQFHRSYADYLDTAQYRLLNLISDLKYTMIYAIHPHELNSSFQEVDTTEFYYVDLDPKFNSWVSSEQEKLKFIWRPNEEQQFEVYKKQHQMKKISLSAFLEDEETFLAEYHRVCNEMQVSPDQVSALDLWRDWRSIRFTEK